MNVYDFDNTILRGDSSARFFGWCLAHRPRMWADIPGQALNGLLFALRLVPFCPLNTFSHLYGTFEYPFAQYMLLSSAAMAPRLLTYSFIGYSVYDPLSSSFIIPMVVLLVLSGCASFFLLGVTGLTYKVNRRSRKKRAALPTEEAAEQT